MCEQTQFLYAFNMAIFGTMGQMLMFTIHSFNRFRSNVNGIFLFCFCFLVSYSQRWWNKKKKLDQLIIISMLDICFPDDDDEKKKHWNIGIQTTIEADCCRVEFTAIRFFSPMIQFQCVCIYINVSQYVMKGCPTKLRFDIWERSKKMFSNCDLKPVFCLFELFAERKTNGKSFKKKKKKGRLTVDKRKWNHMLRIILGKKTSIRIDWKDFQSFPN